MKIIIAVDYLCKTPHRRCLAGFWICLGFSICQRSEYIGFLNIPGLWICQGSEYASGYEYVNVLNIPPFKIYIRVTQGSEYAWISLKNSWICLIMPEHAGICVNMPKSVWMAFFTITHCNPLSRGTIVKIWFLLK